VTVLHGQSSELSRDSINVALSYGLESVEKEILLNRLNSNLKVTIKQYDLALEISDIEIENFENQIKNYQRMQEIDKPKTFWSKIWLYIKITSALAASFVAGAIIGI